MTYAQSYTVDWFAVDGGGGTSTGGVYAVNGNVGQPTSGGSLTGGAYSIEGGFWSVIALQMPGAPFLTIRRGPTSGVVIIWPSPSSGYALQQNSNISTTNWAAVAQSPLDNGTNKSVIISPSSGLKFFRLMKQ